MSDNLTQPFISISTQQKLESTTSKDELLLLSKANTSSKLLNETINSSGLTEDTLTELAELETFTYLPDSDSFFFVCSKGIGSEGIKGAWLNKAAKNNQTIFIEVESFVSKDTQANIAQQWAQQTAQNLSSAS